MAPSIGEIRVRLEFPSSSSHRRTLGSSRHFAHRRSSLDCVRKIESDPIFARIATDSACGSATRIAAQAPMQPSGRRHGPIRFDRRRSPQCRVRYPGFCSSAASAIGVGVYLWRSGASVPEPPPPVAAVEPAPAAPPRPPRILHPLPEAASGRHPVAAAGQQRRVDHRHADRIVRARSVRAVFLSGRPGAPLRCHDRQPSPQDGAPCS